LFPTILEWVVTCAILMWVLPHVLGPILVWYSQKIPEHYRLAPIEGMQGPEYWSSAVAMMHEDLLGLGFEHVAVSELAMNKVSMVFSLYRDDRRRLSGTLVHAKSKAMNFAFAEFTQLYADGSALSIYNAPIASVYPPSQYKFHCRFPKVKAVAELLRITEKIRDGYPNTHPPVVLPKGNEFQAIGMFLDRESNELIQKGWLSSQASNGFRRLTIKGAVLMTWKSCWPWKTILDRMDQRRSLKALQRA
jgi:hypothetical protein